MASKRKVNKHQEQHVLIPSVVSWAVLGRRFRMLWLDQGLAIHREEHDQRHVLAHVGCEVPFAWTIYLVSVCSDIGDGSMSTRSFFPLLFDGGQSNMQMALSFGGLKVQSGTWTDPILGICAAFFVNMEIFGQVRLNGFIMWMCNKEERTWYIQEFYIGQLAKRNLWHNFFQDFSRALAVDHPCLHDHLPDYNTSMSIMTTTWKACLFSTTRPRKIHLIQKSNHKHHSQ